MGGQLSVKISFRGPCEAQGYLQVDNKSGDFVVLDKAFEWSATQPIRQVIGATPIADPGDRLLLRLFAADHSTVLFKSDSFSHSGDESGYFSNFTALLDCSTTPYQAVVSDTAMSDPGRDWLTPVGIALSVAAVGMALLLLPLKKRAD
ncbi:MAG TPA: hypothetical protein VFL75_10565 [Candidatus Limnocylindria bacterium]|nr:hypothetical protein [Candidatus Limnocylindria bacterium]